MRDELITPRLRLRRATMDDLDAIHALLSDPRNMRYWSSPPHETLGQSVEWLRSMVDADPAESDDYIVERDSRAIGKMGCWKLPEIGFMIAADEAGQGYASEALAAFLERRRRIAEPRRLTADVDPRNTASLRLLAAHGFVETGRAHATWNINGEICDSVYLALDL
jgi:ribosomal-protein-alanine N-acetyltransferase